MFRYMIGDVERGGCVLASNEQIAELKVRTAYEKMAAYSDKLALELKDMKITVWRDDEIAADIVEVYP